MKTKEIGVIRKVIKGYTTEKIEQILVPPKCKIDKVYVTYKNEFTTEQEFELYSMFDGINKGAEIYETAKSRLSIVPESTYSLESNKGQSMYIRLGNSLSELNTAYITILYSTAMA